MPGWKKQCICVKFFFSSEKLYWKRKIFKTTSLTVPLGTLKIINIQFVLTQIAQRQTSRNFARFLTKTDEVPFRKPLAVNFKGELERAVDIRDVLCLDYSPTSSKSGVSKFVSGLTAHET
jgi:hypothetical protein